MPIASTPARDHRQMDAAVAAAELEHASGRLLRERHVERDVVERHAPSHVGVVPARDPVVRGGVARDVVGAHGAARSDAYSASSGRAHASH